MKDKSININTIIYFLLLFPFFKPVCVIYLLPTIDKIYTFLQVVSFLGILLLFIKRRIVSKFTIYLFLYQLIIIISTFLNDNSVKTILIDTIQIIALSLLIENGLRNRPIELIKSILTIYEILLTINLVTILLYPNGMYISEVNNFKTNWFLGFDNQHILYILPSLIISFIYSYMHGNKLSHRTIYLLIISISSVLIRKSATSIIGLSLFIVYLFFRKIINKSKICNIYTYLIVSFITFISIVIFKIQNLFEHIIVDILKKDITFTGRTYIWSAVIEYIKIKPLLGYGHEEAIVRQTKYRYWGAVHAHNVFLENLYQGGLVLFCVFLLIILSIAKNLHKYKNTKIAKLMSWGLFIYFIIILTEVFNFEKVIVLFAFAYNIKYLIDASKKVETCEVKTALKT